MRMLGGLLVSVVSVHLFLLPVDRAVDRFEQGQAQVCRDLIRFHSETADAFCTATR